MTSRILCVIGLSSLAAACATSKVAETVEPTVVMEPSPEVPVQWRTVAKPNDAVAIDTLSQRWQAALAAVKQWRRPAVEAEGVLLDPEASLVRPLPPPGRYRCRYLRLAQKQGGFQAFKPWFCFVAEEGDLTTLTKVTGDERPSGRLWPDGDERLVFLGTVAHGKDKAALAYGDSPAANAAGILERVGDFQWRLVLLRTEDRGIDVVELVPDVPPLPLASATP